MHVLCPPQGITTSVTSSIMNLEGKALLKSAAGLKKKKNLVITCFTTLLLQSPNDNINSYLC